jgi:transcriptional regulator GlxA family with amidase domain
MLLDRLLSNLSVYVKPFALCTLDEGWRLHLPGPTGLLFHFVLQGEGVLYGPNGDEHPIFPGHLAGVPGAFDVFQGILAEQSKPDAGSSAMTAALMTQCLVHFFRSLQSDGEDALPWLTALEDDRLGRVVDMILDNPGADYTVESLAETAAMSRSAFAEHFAESFGRSPMSFVNHVRMQRAAQMLAIENMSIDEIARSVGFSSRSHFSRAFKDHLGLPPKTFRDESLAA